MKLGMPLQLNGVFCDGEYKPGVNERAHSIDTTHFFFSGAIVFSLNIAVKTVRVDLGFIF